MPDTPVVFSDQDIDQTSGHASQPLTFGEGDIDAQPLRVADAAGPGSPGYTPKPEVKIKPFPKFSETGFSAPPSQQDVSAAQRAAQPDYGEKQPVSGVDYVPIPRGRGDVSQAKGGYFPPTDIPIQGVKDIAEGYEGFTGLPVPNAPLPPARGQVSRQQPKVQPQSPEEVQQANQRAAAAAKIVGGVGEVGSVMVPGAAAAAPVSVGIGLGTGYLASKAAGAAVHGHVSPQAEDLTRTLAFFIPSALGTISSLRTGTVETPQGKFSAASIFGGKAGAGVRTTPEGTFARVKVGDTTIEVPLNRTGAAPVEPTAPAPAAPLPPTVTSMVKANAAATMGKRVANGMPPVPPAPAPAPTPGEQFGNKLSGQQVDMLAQTVAAAPEGQRNGLIDEAHQNLTKWIGDNKGRVVIDGKIHLVKTPEQAETLAAKLINDAVDKHDKATAEAAKVQKEAQNSQLPAESSQQATSTPAGPVKQFLASSRPPKVQPKQTQPPAPETFSEKDIQPDHEFASTQINIEPKSELGKRHAEAVAAIPEEHLGPNGKEETPHVTVRYGLKDDSPAAIDKIKAAAAKIAPFEATVGKTGSFPATKEGDRPIIANVEKSPELNALRSAVEGAGEFKPDDHGEYKPHVTLGYVKPEHVAKYEGGSHLEGGKVPVDHIVVSTKNRQNIRIPLSGEKKQISTAKQEQKQGNHIDNSLAEGIRDEKYFIRLHPPDSPPISPENAKSTPWGADEEFAKEQTRDGYSSFSNPDRFLEYHRGEPDSHRVGVFSGKIIGKGEDGEPLAFPDNKTIRYTTLGEIRRIAQEDGSQVYKSQKEEPGRLAKPPAGAEHASGEKPEEGAHQAPAGSVQSNASAPEAAGRTAGRQEAGRAASPEVTPSDRRSQSRGPDRRQDIATRKRVSEMSPEERAHALLTSDKTGLPNYTAFKEDDGQFEHVGYADVDDFKPFNAILGKVAVDTHVLPAIGEAFRSAIRKEPGGSIKVYHRSGDEFLFRANDLAAVARVVERVNKELAEAVFTAESPDGTIHEKRGAGLSHGTGQSESAAEHNAEHGAHSGSKEQRKAAGLRSGSRDLPERMGEEPAAGQQTGVSEATREEVSQPQTFHESEIEPEQPPSHLEPSRELFKDPRTGELKTRIGMNKERGIRMTITGLYKDRGPAKMTTEMVQNAFDEVMNLKDPAQRNITFTSGKETITGEEVAFIEIADTGRGMTPEQLGTVFTDVYESGKAGADDAAGGWGVAKTSFQLGGRYFRAVSTVKIDGKLRRFVIEGTPDQLLEGVPIKEQPAPQGNKPSFIGRLFRNPDATVDGPPVNSTGLSARVYLKPEQHAWEASEYFDKAGKFNKAGINFFRQTDYYSQPFKIDGEPRESLGELSAPGANVKLEAGPTADHAMYYMPIHVTNKGLYQFTWSMNIGSEVAGAPQYLLAEISSKVRPGHEDYPFTQSREDLNGKTQEAVSKYVAKNLLEMVRAKQMQRLRAEWKSIEQHKLADGSDIAIYNEQGASSALIKEMIDSPYWNRYLSTVREIEDWFGSRYNKPNLPVVSKRGIFLPIDKPNQVTFGINVPNPESNGGDQAIFLNPFGVARRNELMKDHEPIETAWAMASHQFNTILHEQAHNRERSHGVSHNAIMSEFNALIPPGKEIEFKKKLADAIAGQKGSDYDTAKPAKEFVDALQKYSATVADRHEGRDKNNLRSTGIDSSELRPREDEQRGLSSRDGLVRPSSIRTSADISKGDTVVIPDGRSAQVQYVHPEMNIARVKTEDGKTETVGLKSLKSKSGEAGFAKLDIPSAVADLVKAAHEKVFSTKENATARNVDDTLYGLGKQYDADVLRTIKLLKAVGPTTSPEDQEAIYHHKENVFEPVTAAQEQNLKEVVQPLMDANAEMRRKLNKAGVPMGEDDGYIHRVVQGKHNPLERAMKGKGGTGKGNVLSKSASSLKGRSMFAAEDEDGNRVVIHRNGDTMTAFDNGAASEFAKDKRGLQVGDEFNDKDGQPWTLKQATTKEIEQNTGIRYYKNALATTVVDYLQLRRAERANDALEAMKQDEDFKSLSFKPEHGEMPPDGWRTVNLPQFTGYYFEPHLAETLDRFADDLRMDAPGALEKIGNLMTASLVLNPARHIYNIGNHWLVERGVSGNFNPLTWPRSGKAGIRAIKAVMTQNDDFIQALDHGAPMMSHRSDLRELHKHLVDSLLGYLKDNPSTARKIAEAVGFPNPLNMVKQLYGLGQKMTWMSNDIFFLQSIYEKELGGMKFEEAAAQTAKHIPDYRIPPRVLNSAGLSKFMNSHMLTVFSRYHYGVWKSYGQMLKEVAGPESSLKDRARGLDHMIMLGLLTFVGYELWDKLLKKINGDPKARMVRSGASAVPYLVSEIIKGNKPPEELIQGTFTPAVLPKTAAEIAFNRDIYSGQRVYDRHAPASEIARDISKHVGGALGPTQQVQKAQRSETPKRDFLLYQAGVTFPNSEVQSQAVRLMHEYMRENMTITPELQREMDDKRARIESGNLTPRERKSQLKKQALNELQYYLPHLNYLQIKEIFHAATPEEKQIIRPLMLKKAVGLMRSNPIEGEREGALHAFEER